MNAESKWGAGAVLAIVIVLWYGGVFDKVFAGTALSRQQCAVVYASGATVCGPAMEAFCASQGCDPAP